MDASRSPLSTGSKTAGHTGHGFETGEKPNPFQVYPVRGLSDLDNVVSVTVSTPEVLQVAQAVKDYAQAFGTPSDPRPKLLLAAKGDFGTGKTHLMLYASSVLAAEIEAQRKRSDVSAEIGPPISVMVVSSEAPVEEWYASEFGPLLIEVAKLRDLVRELLARLAETLARADPDPEIQELAPQFRTSRRTLYRMFREPGSFDTSALDERFSAEIARLCPRTSRSFRCAIEALRWEETSELAEDWLAGNELSGADMSRIGVRPEGDRMMRAANTICAVAALSRHLGRPFALFIDEFEHLTRFDRRNGSKRNITWVKRLVESLARRGAMVFISGHWEAWDQQGDFLDRFVGGRPIQLVRLSDKDVLDVILVRAGAGAWPTFTPDAARWVVEETSGNIRRVITVLYDLWSNPAAPKVEITEDAVRLAAQRRLQPGSDSGIVPALETAIRAKGGTLKRNETLGSLTTDLAAYIENDLRLVAKVIHARDELALLGSGERFAEGVKALRTEYPNVRGLVVMVGAVLERHVSTLDAAFPETVLVSGEEPGTVERLPKLVARALEKAPQAVAAATQASQEALEATRLEAVERAIEQHDRSREVFGDDSRSEAVRQTLLPNALEVISQEGKARQRAIDIIYKENESRIFAQYFTALLRNQRWIILMLVSILFLFFQSTGRSSFTDFVVNSGMRPNAAEMYLFVIRTTLDSLSILLFVVAIGIVIKLYFDLVEFRSYRSRELESMLGSDAPASLLLQRNSYMADLLSAYGPRKARLKLIDEAGHEFTLRTSMEKKD